MKTLDQMTEAVRRLLADSAPAAPQYSAATILAALQEANPGVAADLAGDEFGRASVRRLSATPLDLVSGTDEYSAPADALRLAGIEYRASASAEWLGLTLREHSGRPDAGAGCSGPRRSTWFFEEVSSDLNRTGYVWTAGTSWNKVRLIPTPQASGQIRFLYFAVPSYTPDPAPPEEGEPETLEDGDRTVINVPEGYDTLMVHRAAIILAVEDKEDQRAIQTLNAMYAAKFTSFVSGLGGGVVRPERRYIGRTQR